MNDESDVRLLVLSTSRARVVFRSLEQRGYLALALRVCDEAFADVGDVFGSDRRAVASHPRQRIWALLHWTLNVSLPTLGAIFLRDHTTILQGIRAYQHRIEAPHLPFKVFEAGVRKARPRHDDASRVA